MMPQEIGRRLKLAKNPRLNVALDGELLRDFKSLCGKQNISVSTAIRVLVAYAVINDVKIPSKINSDEFSLK